MIQSEKQVLINGRSYIIKIHPGEVGVKTAFEVNRLIGSSAFESKEILSNAFESLSEEDKESIYQNPDGTQASEADVQARFMEKILPKINPLEMLDVAKRFLKSLNADEMFRLTKILFAGVLVDEKPLDYNAHFAGRYGDIVPLMTAVIEFNGFLELDPTDLLRK